MRTRHLLFLAPLLLLGGCIREHHSGDVLTLTFRWWSLLWGFVVPLVLAGIMFGKHPSMWVNGKWRPWWKFGGWEAKEIGYFGALLIAPFICLAYNFDRFTVTPEYFTESSLSPFSGTRTIAYNDIRTIELPKSDSAWTIRRRKKSPPDFVVVTNDGRREEFLSQLAKMAMPTILERARKSGAQVVETVWNPNAPNTAPRSDWTLPPEPPSRPDWAQPPGPPSRPEWARPRPAPSRSEWAQEPGVPSPRRNMQTIPRRPMDDRRGNSEQQANAESAAKESDDSGDFPEPVFEHQRTKRP